MTSIALEIVSRGVVSHLADPTIEIQMMGMNGDQICCASIAISTSEASKPTLSIRSAQPIEPTRSHLFKARVVRVQRIAKIRRRAKSRKHIHHADLLASFGTSVNYTLHFRVERLDVVVRVRARGGNDLGHDDGRLRPLGHDVVDQLAETVVRVLPAVSVAVVSAGVQKDDVGLDAGVGDGVYCAGDLVDEPARVALVVLVRHGAALDGADVVDFGAGGGQRGEEKLTVTVAGGATDAILFIKRVRAILVFGWAGFVGL